MRRTGRFFSRREETAISGEGRRPRIGFGTCVLLPKATHKMASAADDGSASTSIGSSMDMCGTALALDRREVDQLLIVKCFVRSVVFALPSAPKIYCMAHLSYDACFTLCIYRPWPPHPKCTDSPTDLSEVPCKFCSDPNRHHGNLGSKFVWTPGPSSPPIFGGPGRRLPFTVGRLHDHSSSFERQSNCLVGGGEGIMD